MHYFIDLFNYLKVLKDLKKWLNTPWKGKDKQESVLRILAGFGLILNDYDICDGNFNLETIERRQDLRKLFYNNFGEKRFLKDIGDASDLTCVPKSKKILEFSSKKILEFSSKNLNEENIGKYDIEKLFFYGQIYKKNGHDIIYGLCVRDKNRTINKINNCNNTSNKIKKNLKSNETIILDWTDLENGLKKFQELYRDINLNDFLNKNKKPLFLKMHQKLTIMKTMKKYGENILWGLFIKYIKNH